MKNFSRSHQGFSLIEVMVAVVILAIGLLGLAKFQAELTRNTAETKTRASALALAERKMEDLRSFTEIKIPIDASGNPAPVANTFYFDEIAANAGGTESGGALNLPSGTHGIGGENYTLTWTLAAVPIAAAQEINVNVAWTDLDGPQNVTLTEIISATNPGAASPVGGAAAISIEPPHIAYTPGIAPEVIAVDLGDVNGEGLKKETSKPLPDVFHNGDYNKVTFDVVTYNSVQNEVIRREQFVNVNCLCTASSGDSFTPAYMVFENGSETIHDQEGTVVTKNTGVVANNQQPDECVVCCRDHSDSVTGTSGAGETIAYGTTNYDASNDYPEVCRMKYVNGKLRVYQDWNLKTVTVFPDSFVSAAATTTQTEYKNYVTAFVKDDTTPKASILTTTRDVTLNQGGNNQLQARPIYIDNVYNASGVSPSYAIFLAAKITANDSDTLQYIPFFEVNLTKLANWTDSNCTDDGGTGVCVSNEAIVDEGPSENNYSRGLATADGTTTLAATSVIKAQLNEGNSGVVGEADNTGGMPPMNAEDNITATVGAAVVTFDVTGSIGVCALSNPGANARKDALFDAVEGTNVVTYTGTSSGSCAVTGNGNSRTMTCSSIPAAGANITIAISTVPAAIVSVTLSNHSGITGAVTNVDAVICDY